MGSSVLAASAPLIFSAAHAFAAPQPGEGAARRGRWRERTCKRATTRTRRNEIGHVRHGGQRGPRERRGSPPPWCSSCQAEDISVTSRVAWHGTNPGASGFRPYLPALLEVPPGEAGNGAPTARPSARPTARRSNLSPASGSLRRDAVRSRSASRNPPASTGDKRGRIAHRTHAGGDG